MVKPSDSLPRSYILLCLTTPYELAMVLPLVYDAAQRQSDRSFLITVPEETAYLLIEPPSNLVVHPFNHRQEGAYSLARKLHRKYPKATTVDLCPTAPSRAVRMWLRLMGHKVAKPRSLKKLRRMLTKEYRKAPHGPMPGIHLLFAQTMRQAGMDVGAGTYLLRQTPDRCVGVALYAEKRENELTPDKRQALMDALVKQLPGYRIVLFGNQGRYAAEWHDDGRVEWAKDYGGAGELYRLSQMSCLVSMDSAYQHIGAMLGVPVVSIWLQAQPVIPFRPYRVPVENCIGLSGDAVEVNARTIVAAVQRVLNTDDSSR